MAAATASSLTYIFFFYILFTRRRERESCGVDGARRAFFFTKLELLFASFTCLS